LLAAVRSERAGLAPTADERAATVETGWTVGCTILPVGSLTLKCQILEHAGAQPIPALIQGLFDLGNGGIGMLQAPLVHTTQDVDAEGFG